MIKPKHIPIRTCVACRETDEKRDLLRVVRQPDGSVCYDPKGKMSGRGAYVCARSECIALAKKQKKFERSLKVTGIADALFVELGAKAAAIAGPEPGAASPPLPPSGSVSEPSKGRERNQATQESEGEGV
ncbi:MAG TPA: YlxR family protein [Chthonomonadaceae bacterium]|nr:YlxR family protein [Chthonomonadaceae bacterium]